MSGSCGRPANYCQAVGWKYPTSVHSFLSLQPLLASNSIKAEEEQGQEKLPTVLEQMVWFPQNFKPSTFPLLGSHSLISLQAGWAKVLSQKRPEPQSSLCKQPISSTKHTCANFFCRGVQNNPCFHLVQNITLPVATSVGLLIALGQAVIRVEPGAD